MQTIHKRQELLPLASTWIHSRVLVGSVLLIFLVFCVVFLGCFFFLGVGGVRLVSCMPYVASVSGLSILDCPLGFHQRLFSTLMLYWTTTDFDIHKRRICIISKPNFNTLCFYYIINMSFFNFLYLPILHKKY